MADSFFRLKVSQSMRQYVVVLVLGIISYFIGVRIFDYMDYMKREEWNVIDLEQHLRDFAQIKYNFMTNLTELESNQDTLMKHAFLDEENIEMDVLAEDILIYLQSLNESMRAMNESVVLMRFVSDSCKDLIDTLHASQSQQTENDTLSQYNPLRLLWNVHHIYTAMAMDEKCKSYATMLESLILSSKHILSLQRDFLSKTKIRSLFDKFHSDSDIHAQITGTIQFVERAMFFE